MHIYLKPDGTLVSADGTPFEFEGETLDPMDEWVTGEVLPEEPDPTPDDE
jgi:hypothetical protein